GRYHGASEPKRRSLDTIPFILEQGPLSYDEFWRVPIGAGHDWLLFMRQELNRLGPQGFVASRAALREESFERIRDQIRPEGSIAWNEAGSPEQAEESNL